MPDKIKRKTPEFFEMSKLPYFEQGLSIPSPCFEELCVTQSSRSSTNMVQLNSWWYNFIVDFMFLVTNI